MTDLPVRLAQPITLLLAPVLAVQGLKVRRGTPRLPEASGPRAGTVTVAGTGTGTGTGTDAGTSAGAGTGTGAGTVAGAGTGTGTSTGTSLRLAVLGESTAAGVGAATHDEGLAGHLARAAAVRTAGPVSWQVVARSGINTRTTTAELVPLLEPADVVVVVLGINELLELNRPPRFERELRELVAAVRDRIADVPILMTGMPPVDRFPALPQPLRAVLGLRARALDRVMRHVANDTAGATHVSVDIPPGRDGVFAVDGFHPSAAGYEAWAEGLVGSLPGVSPVGWSGPFR
ncbi:SGNH/GDSL hydrolase family protein [Streptosporangium sp. CA-135522]|uniref:SGNH/GDSL hydrolase family protein n=1 Tax=Streptosporangium sp. CA-135522 TaxID=3240072 RepID=UPI003D8E54D0